MKLQLIKNNKGHIIRTISLSNKIMNALDWNKGDEITQHVNKDGQIILSNLTKINSKS